MYLGRHYWKPNGADLVGDRCRLTERRSIPSPEEGKIKKRSQKSHDPAVESSARLFGRTMDPKVISKCDDHSACAGGFIRSEMYQEPPGNLMQQQT